MIYLVKTVFHKNDKLNRIYYCFPSGQFTYQKKMPEIPEVIHNAQRLCNILKDKKFEFLAKNEWQIAARNRAFPNWWDVQDSNLRPFA